jgi:hypothetical protein
VLIRFITPLRKLHTTGVCHHRCWHGVVATARVCQLWRYSERGSSSRTRTWRQSRDSAPPVADGGLPSGQGRGGSLRCSSRTTAASRRAPPCTRRGIFDAPIEPCGLRLRSCSPHHGGPSYRVTPTFDRLPFRGSRSRGSNFGWRFGRGEMPFSWSAAQILEPHAQPRHARHDRGCTTYDDQGRDRNGPHRMMSACPYREDHCENNRCGYQPVDEFMAFDPATHVL